VLRNAKAGIAAVSHNVDVLVPFWLVSFQKGIEKQSLEQLSGNGFAKVRGSIPLGSAINLCLNRRFSSVSAD
jgi:hypothetical protein